MKPTHIGLYIDMIPKSSILFKWHCEVVNMPISYEERSKWAEWIEESRQTIRLFLN